MFRIEKRFDYTRKAVMVLAGIAAPLIAGVAIARAQSKDPAAQEAAQPKLAFEVASVKPAVRPGRGPAICLVPCSPGERLTLRGTRLDIRYMPISDLLVRAYRIKPYQVSGPTWIREDRFDIMATIPEGVPPDRLPEMLQALLADRFKLTLHRETKDVPVYALIVGKNGIKLPPSEADAGVEPPAGPKALQMFTPEGDAHMENGRISITGGPFGPIHSAPGGKWEFSRLTMPALAEFLTAQADRPVIDQTGLPGAYRLVYEINAGEGGEDRSRADSSPSAVSALPARVRVMTSLLDAVETGGLKLERRSAPVETLVIDHVEKTPTAN